MINLGDVKVSSVIDVPFYTKSQVNGSALTATVVLGDVKVYKNGGTTPRSSTAGFTLSVDFNSITGTHQLSIDLSNNEDNGFWATGSDYQVLLDTFTVDGQTLSKWIGKFSINNRIADLVWNAILQGSTYNITNSAGKRLRAIQEFQGYESGAIWVNTVTGTPGVVLFENGTVENHSSNMADAEIIANGMGFSKFEISPRSNITFDQAHTNHAFLGNNWILNLGTQVLSGCFIKGANISGEALLGAAETEYEHCMFNSVTLPPIGIRYGRLTGTLTMGSAGDFYLCDCRSRIAGFLTPKIDFNETLNASNLNMRNYSGGIEILNMGVGTGTYNMSLEGQGQLIIHASCVGGNIAVRGNFKVTNNGSNMVIDQTANFSNDQIFNSNIRKNVALANFPFYMIDSVSKSGKTGLTVTSRRSVDGGVFAPCANTASQIGLGGYKINLEKTDVNGKTILFIFTAPGAVDRVMGIVTQE